MAVLASTIVASARTLLQDASGVRWTDAELLGYLNEGQGAVVVLKPTAYVKVAVVELVAGTRQQIPDDGEQLIDVTRNLGTNGTTPGRAIRIVDRGLMDAADINWHAADPSAETRNYMYELTAPKYYMVSPPQPASARGHVEIVYGAIPPAVALDGNIALADSYRGALLDYVLSRALQKETEVTAGTNKPLMHRTAFISSVTGKALGEVATNPNATAPAAPAKPNARR